ncbi:MAG: Inner membrane transport permease YhhJ [Candidatus Erwinia impunctatus]|nr:Inner membrane transport permease YhhJ [Culicoides impunctatus]
MAMGSLKPAWHSFWLAFRHEITVSWRKPVIHWLGWCFPLLLFALITSNFSEGTLLNLPVVAVDNDHSTLSKTLIRNLNAGSHAKVEAISGGLSEAESRIRQSQAYAALYIPHDFEADVLAGRQPAVKLYYNALYYGAGLYSTQDFSGLVSSLSSQYSKVLATAVGRPMPALPTVSLAYDSLFNASGSYIYYQQFGATVHLLQLFTVTCMIYMLSRSRPLIFKRHFGFSLLGKLAPYTLCYTALLMVEIALLVGTFGASVAGNPLYMLCVGFFYVIAAQSIGVLLYTFTGSAITAYTLMGILVSVALTFSGMAIPILSMPFPAQVIANIEPLTHALYALFDIFLRDVPGRPVAYTCAFLLIYPLLTVFLVRKRLLIRLEKGEGQQ